MPLAAIGIGLGTALAGGAAAGATIYGAKKSASANTDAANIAAKSQSDASAAQTKSNEDTLAFTKQQAENDYRNQEITRKANYDQYASGQNRLKFLDNEVGLPERTVPSYVPSQDPNFGGTPSAGQVLGSPSSGGSSVMDALTKNYAALGVTPTGPGTGPTDIAYMAGKINETGGLTPDNTKYWFGPQGRIAQELSKAKSGSTPTATPPAAAPYSAASYLQQRQNPLPTALSY